MASATPQLPLACATALQPYRQNGCEDADVRLRGHKMSEAIRSAAILHGPGRLHIGGAAHFVWASPPNYECTARRHVHVY
jgi:hypothetical protein